MSKIQIINLTIIILQLHDRIQCSCISVWFRAT